MKAVIMAGGFGTRLRPLTCNIPKPMVPVMNRPMMEHIVSLLKRHGITDIVSSLFYQKSIIKSHFGDGSAFGVKMDYFEADADFGTAGSVRLATEGTNERVLVISGDVFTDIDLSAVIRFHEEKKSRATLVLTHSPNPLQFGVVITEEDGKISRFLEKPSWGEVFSDTINTGIYVLEPEVLQLIPLREEYDFGKDLFPLLLRQNAGLYGCIVDGYWRDIGNLNEYQDAHIDALQGKVRIAIDGRKEGNVFLGKGSTLPAHGFEATGTVVIGENCTIGDDVSLSNAVIGNRCIIRPAARIANSVLWDDVQIGFGAELTSDVIGSRSVVGEKSVVAENVFVSDECTIGRSAHLNANIKVWPNKTVMEGAVLTRSLVWEDRWLRELFTDARISGRSNIEMNPEFGAKLGAALGAYIGPGKTVVTCRDADNVSRMMSRAMICGLISAGVNIYDLRATAIPLLRHELSTGKEAGGIHVRRSPIDEGMTDIIFFDHQGKDLPTKRTKSVERLFFGEDFARAQSKDVGSISFPERTTEAYKERFLSSLAIPRLNSRKFKIVIDYSNGVASTIFPIILGSFDCQVLSLNGHLDPKKLTRNDYEKDASLRQISHIVPLVKYDLGCLIDAGGEKLNVINDAGEVIDDERLLAITTALFLETHPDAKTIAVPVSSTGEVDMIAAKFGVTVVKTKDNHLAMMNAAEQPEVRFVGGTRGGFIFTDFFFATDAMYSVAKLLEMLAATGKSLGALDRELPRLHRAVKKVDCGWEHRGKVMRKILQATESFRRDLVDGVRIYLPGDGGTSSVILIPVKDDAKFQIISEATDLPRAETLAQEYEQRIRHWRDDKEAV